MTQARTIPNDTVLRKVVPSLKGEALLLRSETPGLILALHDCEITGINGGLFMAPPEMSLDTAAELLSGNHTYHGERSTDYLHEVSNVSDRFMRVILRPSEEIEDIAGYTAAQVSEAARFIEDRYAREALDWLCSASIDARSVSAWLTFFALGDQAARSQAVQEFPVIASSLLSLPNVMRAIDARTEIAPELAIDLRPMIRDFMTEKGNTAIASAIDTSGVDVDTLSTSVARKLMHIEGLARRSLASDSGQKSDFLLVNLSEYYLNRLVKTLAFTRWDQIPNDWPKVASMTSCFILAEQCALNARMSVAPVLRAIRNTSSDGWPDLEGKLKTFTKSEATLVRDYLHATSQRVASGIAVDMLRQRIAPDAFAQIASGSEALWGGNPVSALQADMLSEFVKIGGYNFHSSLGFNIRSEMEAIRDRISRAICTRFSMKHLSEMQERWHFNTAQITSKSLSDTGNISWTPLLGIVSLDSGLRAVELADSASLSEQGARERHCVGGHAMRILNAGKDTGIAIFSIEREDGHILSTIEMTAIIHNSKGKSPQITWGVSEHKAAQNSVPCPAAQAAASELLSRIMDLPAGETLAYIDTIARNPDKLLGEMQNLVALMMVNPCNPDIPEIAIAASDPVLPRSLRGLSPEEWRDLLKRDDTILGPLSIEAGLTSAMAKCFATADLINAAYLDATPQEEGLSL